MKVEDLQVVAYSLPAKHASIQWRGNDTWAVVGAGLVLNREGEWEYEPNPSSRSDEFIERTRYNSPQGALDAWLSSQSESGGL